MSISASLSPRTIPTSQPLQLPKGWRCAICLSGKKWKVLAIPHNDSNGKKHPLHPECLETWVKVKDTCPVCSLQKITPFRATFIKNSASLVEKTKNRPKDPEVLQHSALWDYGANLVRLFTLTAVFSKMPVLGGIGCLASAALDSVYLGDKYKNYERSLFLKRKVEDLRKNIQDKNRAKFKENLRSAKELFSPFDSGKEHCLTIRNTFIKWSTLSGENPLSSDEIQSEATSLEENVHKLSKDLLSLYDLQWAYIKGVQALGLWCLYDAAVSFLSPLKEERV